MKTKAYKQGWDFATIDYTEKRNPLLDNPYTVWVHGEKYFEWSIGYRDGVETIYDKLFRPKYLEEDRQERIRIEEEFRNKEEEKVAKKHAKTKKGKAEAAGQNTLF